MGQPAHAVFQIKTVGPQDRQVRGDLLRHGLGRADEEGSPRSDLEQVVVPGRDRKAAHLAQLREHVEVARPELLARLLVGFGDVARRVDADRQGRTLELGQGQPEELREGLEARRRAADDRQHQRKPITCCAHNRLRAAADADPRGKRTGFQVRHHILVRERSSRISFPGHRGALEQLGEQVQLLLEQLLVIGQVVAEKGKRVDA